MKSLSLITLFIAIIWTTYIMVSNMQDMPNVVLDAYLLTYIIYLLLIIPISNR